LSVESVPFEVMGSWGMDVEVYFEPVGTGVIRQRKIVVDWRSSCNKRKARRKAAAEAGGEYSIEETLAGFHLTLSGHSNRELTFEPTFI
jgi:hypothetical protein